MNLDQLIPHRPPMRLIDEIVGEVDGFLVCRGRIPAALALDGAASPLLGLEMGAQAAAVLGALDRGAGNDEPPTIGYLVSVRGARFETAELPAERSLTVRVRFVGGVHPLSTYEIRVSERGAAEPCLAATIGTYLTGPTAPRPAAERDR